MLTPKAAALKYRMYEDGAPKIVAAGKGEIAKKIIEKARAYDVPLFQNPALADALLRQPVGSEIEPKLFKAVAEVFVWLMKSEASAKASG